MAITKKLKDVGKSIKSTAKKVVRKVDKAVVAPVGRMMGADGKRSNRGSKSRRSRSKSARKK